VDIALNRTPLEQEHASLGAKMGEFGGWAMPIEYAGVLTEHRAVREAVGMFDLTHLGKVDVEGPGAADWLQSVLTNDISAVDEGQAQYNLVLTEGGGIVDDLIVYRVSEDRYLVVPNAANTEKVLEILSSEARRSVVVTHRPELCTLAVQGPTALELAAQVFPDVDGLGYMRCAEGSYRDVVVLVARSGYTGERGVELFLPDAVVRPLWRELLDRGRPLGMEPCGLGARDTLRLEMGYPLHGNDISEDRTPLEAGLSWAVAMGKGEFRGRQALVRQREEGIPARLRALRMVEKLIPRAYLSPAERFGPDARVEVDVRGRRGEAEVIKPPFVDRSPR
jgi:aminomethyltransferase